VSKPYEGGWPRACTKGDGGPARPSLRGHGRPQRAHRPGRRPSARDGARRPLRRVRRGPQQRLHGAAPRGTRARAQVQPRRPAHGLCRPPDARSQGSAPPTAASLGGAGQPQPLVVRARPRAPPRVTPPARPCRRGLLLRRCLAALPSRCTRRLGRSRRWGGRDLPLPPSGGHRRARPRWVWGCRGSPLEACGAGCAHLAAAGVAGVAGRWGGKG
jgi:hypothetical protein